MPLHANNILLKDALESTVLLAGRYEAIKLVNWDATTGEKRGCFSLVFKAFDRVEGKDVALKFYDLDPMWAPDLYRRQAFLREHEILQTLINHDRCLQLSSAMNIYNLQLPLPDGTKVIIACQYFAVEWINDGIDDFFLKQETFDAVDKLRLFNEVVLAVEALHSYEVFHRDLKADNLRSYQNALKRIVVAIDLGTAARFSASHLQADYNRSVGAPAYAAVEALCGLAGHRKLAPQTDLYALGCLLFELFNFDYFYARLYSLNPNYPTIQIGMTSFLNGVSNEQDQLNAWKKAISKFSNNVVPVQIDGPGSSVPPGISDLLNECLQSLTHVNFERRIKSFNHLRSRIWASIRVLENQKSYKIRMEKMKKNRLLREQKVIDKANRLAARLLQDH